METMPAAVSDRVVTPLGAFYRSSRLRHELREQLQSYAGGRIKWAALGGDQEGSFEQAFSSLAYNYLKDKAPRLIDYIVGFQLVDRNEDNTKAIGLFGIKLGNKWLYAPVFFLNGELKGHELLYLKDQDRFVPMKENWVNFLLSRKPHILGEGSPQDAYGLGGLAPDITRFSVLPGMGKISCDAWVKPILPFFGACATLDERVFAKSASLGTALDLRACLGQDVRLAAAAFQVATSRPAIKAAFDRFYGKKFFAEVGTTLRDREFAKQGSLLPSAPTPQPKRSSRSLLPEPPVIDKRAEETKQKGKLKVYEDAALTKNLHELDADERARLLRDGVLIKDERDPHAYSMVYDTQVLQVLTNPDQTGLYEVLERPASFERMLVIANPVSQRGREDFATVMRLGDGEKAWMNGHMSKIWVRQDSQPQDFREWWQGLSDSRTLDPGALYVAVGEDGDGSVPFKVRDDLGEGSYKVDFEEHVAYDHGRDLALPSLAADSRSTERYYSSYGAILRINVRKGTKLRAIGGELNVPESYKFLKIKEPPRPRKSSDPRSLLPGDAECDGPWDSGSQPKPIQPGILDDIQLLFTEKTAGLRIRDLGGEFLIQSPRGEDQLTKQAALISLLRDHGFREATARTILARAEKDRLAEFRVKYADLYGGQSLQPGPTGPAFPEALTGTEYNGPKSVASIYPQEEFQPVSSLDASRNDPATYDIWRNFEVDHGALQTAQQAGQKGQKEVFDASMIAGLLKAVRQDTLVDRYVPALEQALDKIGRLIFMFNWHQEEFADRYGESSLPELEDTLRNAFDVLGDLVLFLREKSVDNVVDDMSPNIEDASRN